MVGGVQNEQKDVKKEFLYKNLQTNLLNCYTVTLVDEKQIVQQRQKLVKGSVPRVEILAQKVKNKKATTISGLELYMIEFDEFTSHLQHRCASSVSMTEHHLHTEKNPKYSVMVQGAQTK